ncbi:MAG: hypothetical protein J0L63_11470 [Anaerolineae bacterium]|nr:hypothetical protein [Anaerolineae bacterium]MBN8619518.1 hypothetical protein [Anaerolineae bacterium]
MQYQVILAHGALGIWDEVIFLSIGAIFLVMMGISWVRSRNSVLDEEIEADDGHSTNTTDPSDERFRLE